MCMSTKFTKGDFKLVYNNSVVISDVHYGPRSDLANCNIKLTMPTSLVTPSPYLTLEFAT